MNVRSLIYFFSLIAGWPCVFYLMGWLPSYQINYLCLLGACLIFVIGQRGHTIPLALLNLILIQGGAWILYSAIHLDTSYFTRILMLAITLLILQMQYNDRIRTRFIKIFDGWVLLQAVLGTIGIILVLSGLLQPIFEFKEMDFRTGYFFGLFTTNTYNPFSLGIVRNAGFYDEPGALAFWGVFALLFNKAFIKNRKIEYILIFGLISTLSIAYYIQLALYLLVFYRKQSWKMIVLIGTIYVAMKMIASYNPIMEQAIFGRFEYNEATGSIEGDNRSELFERCWRIFCQFPVFGAGARTLASPEMFHKYGFLGANFFYNWAADGLVGVIFTYLPLIALYKLGKHQRLYRGVALILLVGYLQRPFDTTQLLYPLTLYAFLMFSYLDVQSKGFLKKRTNTTIRPSWHRLPI